MIPESQFLIGMVLPRNPLGRKLLEHGMSQFLIGMVLLIIFLPNKEDKYMSQFLIGMVLLNNSDKERFADLSQFLIGMVLP